MESKLHPIEFEIGVIQYDALVEFFYIEGKQHADPTERIEPEYRGFEFVRISGYKEETNENWFVTDPDELKMIRDWVDFEDVFNQIEL
jgi:hypothetical protein